MEKLAINGGNPVRTKEFPERTPFGEDEIREVTELIKTQNLFAPSGTKSKEFERAFNECYGTKHAIMCNSGTAALHMAVAALDLEPGSEIITAPVTDLGTVIGIVFQGCIPIFADWRPGTINMDPADIERKITPKTGAILVVHLAGNPCDMDAIMAVAAKHDLPVIEDCAQAYLTEYKGKLAGTMGKIGCFSMQQSKHLTAGEGGVAITNDDDLAHKMGLFRDKGWERWQPGDRKYASLGMNYRPNELTAAVAVAQMRKLHDVVANRRRLSDQLSALIADIPGIAPPEPAEGAVGSVWFYALMIDGYDPARFGEAVRAEGVPLAVGYTGKPIYLCSEAFTKKRTFGSSGYPFNSPYYGKEIEYCEGLCPVAEAALPHLGVLVISENWSADDIDDVAKALRKVAAGLPKVK